LELFAVEVFLLVLGVGDDEQDDVLLTDVVVDDVGTAAFPVAFGGAAEFTQASSARNQVASVGLRGEQHLQFKDFRFRKQIGGSLLKGGEAHKFHAAKAAPLA
jgi:hypothetical protein